MKKLIAISVVLALVAGVAFAQPSVGGNLKISTALAGGQGDNQEVGAATIWDAHTNVQWSGDNAGGMMRLHAGSGNHSGIDWTPEIFTFWWWKPNDFIRLQLGVNPDGDWGNDNINGWGFNAEAQGGIAIDQHRWLGGEINGDSPALAARLAGWYGGISCRALLFSLYPIEGLAINWGIPMEGETGENAIRDAYLNSTLNFKYQLDMGTITVATNLLGFDANDDFVTPEVFASFYLIGIDDMAIDVGLAFKEDFENIGIGLGFKGV